MFTLLVATLVLWLYENRNPKHDMWFLPLFLFGSILPEYWIVATSTVIAAYFYCKNSRGLYLLLWVLSVVAFVLINLNFYAMLAVPIILLASKVHTTVPRLRYFFYTFYPAHFVVLWIVKTLMP
jgi:TraX protein